MWERFYPSQSAVGLLLSKKYQRKRIGHSATSIEFRGESKMRNSRLISRRVPCNF
jgi:hypothetical protein